jgi:hypothetical protein
LAVDAQLFYDELTKDLEPYMLRVVFLSVFMFLFSTLTASAEIYRWVDENGTVHFTDTPYSEDAKQVKIESTGIKLHGEGQETNGQSSATNKNQEPSVNSKKSSSPVKKKQSMSPYRFSANVGEIGADIIRISGRVSSGPKCEKLTVTASASTDTGLTASVTTTVRKPNSFGSVVFEGNNKVSGSSEDYGFWDIDSITATCND